MAHIIEFENPQDMEHTYYRCIRPQCVMYFYHNHDSGNLEGVITEVKTNNTLSVRRGNHGNCWNDVENNVFAKQMITDSSVITKEEYAAVNGLVDVFMNEDAWLTTDPDIMKEGLKKYQPIETEKVTEVVYC